MKIVFDPKTEQVIEIDETKEPKWQQKYRHRSGKPFVWVEPTKEEAKKDVLDDLDIEVLRGIYEDKLGKPVANRYKNDKDWILDQLV